MSAVPFEVQARSESRKGEMRRLRETGLVPGVVYGHGSDASAIKVDSIELFKHLRDKGRSHLLQLESDDKDVKGRHALIREVQVDPVSRKYLHVDFQAVNLDQEIVVDVPIEYVGDPVGEKKAGGARNIRRYYVTLKCRADSIPDMIVIDITDMDVGDTIHAGDLDLPDGTTLDMGEEITLVQVELRRRAVIPTPTAALEAEAEGEAGEEGEGEAGEEGSEEAAAEGESEGESDGDE